jgi:hypothetical protein
MQTLLQEALRLHQMGQLPRAELLYEPSIQVDPQNPNAYNLLSVLKRQLKQDALAIPVRCAIYEKSRTGLSMCRAEFLQFSFSARILC